MKPTVLLDVDGVVADFTQAAITLVNQITGKSYRPEDVKTWEVFNSIPEPEAHKEVYRIMKGEGGCLSIPVYPEALDGVRTLRELAYIICVTSPFAGSPTWVHERELWLDRHFGGEVSYTIHTKHKERIHGDIFLDDKAEHVIGWSRYWRDANEDMRQRALLWGSPRTNEVNLPSAVTRVTSWEEVHEVARNFPNY